MANLTGADLLQPIGEIEPSLFRPEAEAAVEARLDAYLAEAYAKDTVTAITVEATRNRAAAAWSYHRAYMTIASIMARSPSQMVLNEQGQRVIAAEQYRYFKALADEKLAEFLALAPDVERAEVMAPTTSVRHRTYF